MLERMQNVCAYHLHEIQQTISQAPLKTQNPLILKMTDIGRFIRELKKKNILCRRYILTLKDYVEQQ